MKRLLISLACLSLALTCAELHAASNVKKRAIHKTESSSSSSSSSSSCSCKKGKKTFISAVAFDEAASTQVIAAGSPFIFNEVVDREGGVRYSSNTGIFTIDCPGHYQITYGGKWAPVGTAANPPNLYISLSINGTVLPASRINSPDFDGDWSLNSIIVYLPASSTLELINDPLTGSAIQLLDPANNSTSASITIVKVG